VRRLCAGFVGDVATPPVRSLARATLSVRCRVIRTGCRPRRGARRWKSSFGHSTAEHSTGRRRCRQDRRDDDRRTGSAGRSAGRPGGSRTGAPRTGSLGPVEALALPRAARSSGGGVPARGCVFSVRAPRSWWSRRGGLGRLLDHASAHRRGSDRPCATAAASALARARRPGTRLPHCVDRTPGTARSRRPAWPRRPARSGAPAHRGAGGTSVPGAREHASAVPAAHAELSALVPRDGIHPHDRHAGRGCPRGRLLDPR